MMPTVGQKAPSFSAPNQKGEIVSLSDFEGQKVVLYFYPKDDTPGCTAEACDLRDNYERFLNAGFVVLGVSRDNQKSHQKFIEKYNLPFDLLDDSAGTVSDAYGTWVEKSMYGRKYMGMARVTFVIDENGVIEKVIDKVNTKAHAAQIL